MRSRLSPEPPLFCLSCDLERDLDRLCCRRLCRAGEREADRDLRRCRRSPPLSRWREFSRSLLGGEDDELLRRLSRDIVPQIKVEALKGWKYIVSFLSPLKAFSYSLESLLVF